MKILHISDLHFSIKIPWSKLKGKMIAGYINFILRRQKKHPLHLRESLLSFIQTLEYDCLIISGDITNFSHELEFIQAREILSPILDERAFLIPGNHDRYVKSALQPVDLFEKYFGEFSGESISEKFYLKVKKIKNQTIIGWDSNMPTPIAVATGYIDTEVFTETFNYLKKNQIHNYILTCHHPIWNPNGLYEGLKHQMVNKNDILHQIKNRPPLAYLHGHNHTNWIRFKNSEVPFYIVNSASSTRLSNGSNHNCGFHEITILDNSDFIIKRYEYSLESKGFRLVEPILYEI